MQQESDAFLIVEKGEPYHSGETLPLVGGKVWLGRGTRDNQPDFSFRSPYISRRHATIECKDGAYLLTGLPGSRHGTYINGKRLVPGESRELRERDQISLAREEVVLTFSIAARTDLQTWSYPELQQEPSAVQNWDNPPLILIPSRHQVILDGQPHILTGKVYDLLCLPFENQGQPVSRRTIKITVWQERELGVDGNPLVTDVELNNLVRRLREFLGPHRDLVRTVPGYGYMLDLE
jgi:DNA-binding winged helix-turn-helix (wHTH) protein